MKRETKNKVKKGLTAVLAVGILAGFAAGGKALYDYSKEDLKTIHPTFHVGGLDENGEFLDTDQSLYTKDLIPVQDLHITTDFDNNISYKIFLYDEDKKNDVYIYDSNDTLANLEKEEYKYNDGENYSHFRIVIYPEFDKYEDEEKVNLLNIGKYTKQINIEINKNQEKYIDLNNDLNNDLFIESILQKFDTNEYNTDSKFLGYYSKTISLNYFECEDLIFNLTDEWKKNKNNKIYYFSYNSSGQKQFTYISNSQIKNNKLILNYTELKEANVDSIVVGYTYSTYPILELTEYKSVSNIEE